MCGPYISLSTILYFMGTCVSTHKYLYLQITLTLFLPLPSLLQLTAYCKAVVALNTRRGRTEGKVQHKGKVKDNENNVYCYQEQEKIQ
jgi:hypothetical protein